MMCQRHAWKRWLWLVLVVQAAACGSGDALRDGESTEEPAEVLALGASGERVEELQARLRAIGYFPNAALGEQFPDWRPLVPSEPARGQFDEPTQTAVSLFQVRSGLSSSGAVDELTSTLLFAPRCGVPDGVAASDPSQKFALGSNAVSPGTTLKWRVLKKGPGVEISDVEQAADRAGFIWGNYSSVRFRRANTGEAEHFSITFGETSGATSTFVPIVSFLPGQIKLNFQTAWSVVDPPLELHRDVVTELMHQFGHMVGIAHSTLQPSIMTARVPEFDRTVHVDDMVAISARYDQWESFDPCVKDIDSKAIPNQPARSTWAIECGSGDRPVWQYFQGTWRRDPIASSTRIAVDRNGRPWTVDADGAIHTKNSSESTSGTWRKVSGCANDVGADGSVWIVGCTAATGGFRMERFNGSSFVVDASGGAASRVAVDTLGRPWVVNSQHAAFRRTTDSTGGGSWIRLNTSSPFVFASDIGINSDVYAWVVNGSETFLWNEQPGASPGQSGIFSFVNTHGVAPNTPLVGVAGMTDGSALAVAFNGTVWRTSR